MVARRTSTEIQERHKEHDDLYWFSPPESKTLRPVWRWYYAKERATLEEGVDVVLLRGTPGCLILAGMPWVTSWFPSILVSYNRESLSEPDCLVMYTKYLYVLGPTCHVGEGPLTGRRVFW
jgi:hypothetical protein